ncbi:MAG: hypothetical protein HLUCCX21_04595 [Porphyrobacter sp. HL-46]|nr:MAG: hypothetical protein HLUCCX21_04595 [Porphyrobacter sp. HL-46]
MIFGRKTPLGPGEAHSIKRHNRYIAYLAFCGIVGGMAGFATGFFDQGDGNLLAGDWELLRLPPGLALVIAGLLLAGFLAFPIYSFRLVDDYQREHGLIGYSGGFLGMMSGFPTWAALYGGGFVPAPHAFGIFAIGFVSMCLSYLYARWRL